MIAPARKAAFELLLELKRKPESHSDVLLRSKRMEALSPLDRNLATTLVMGVLRWQLVLQQRIREALTKSKGHLADAVQVSLELGALQLLLLDRIPAHAAIFESVELVRQSGNPYAVGLANAVLRKLTQAAKAAGGGCLRCASVVDGGAVGCGVWRRSGCRNLPLRSASSPNHDSPYLAGGRGSAGFTTGAGNLRSPRMAGRRET